MLFEFDLETANGSGNKIVERRVDRTGDGANQAVNDGPANQSDEPTRQAAEGAQTASGEREPNSEENTEDRGDNPGDLRRRNDANAFQYLHAFLPWPE